MRGAELSHFFYFDPDNAEKQGFRRRLDGYRTELAWQFGMQKGHIIYLVLGLFRYLIIVKINNSSHYINTTELT